MSTLSYQILQFEYALATTNKTNHLFIMSHFSRNKDELKSLNPCTLSTIYIAITSLLRGMFMSILTPAFPNDAHRPLYVRAANPPRLEGSIQDARDTWEASACD